MNLDQIEAEKAKLDAMIAEFQNVERTEIPEKIAAAVESNWELHLDQIQTDGARLAYLSADRKADAKRLIRFGDAMQILQAMEERLIDEVCRDEIDIMWGQVKAKFAAFRWLSENWKNLGEIFGKIADNLKFIQEGIPVFVANLTLSLAVPEFAKAAKKVFQTRDLFPVQMRKKALPQREVKRRYRRKVSRL